MRAQPERQWDEHDGQGGVQAQHLPALVRERAQLLKPHPIGDSHDGQAL
jgi:hypothetical protein